MKKCSLYTTEECEKIEEEAALRYVKDTLPGISRRQNAQSFIYYDSNGNKITDELTLKRISGLRIPPAYQEVWICPKANGHIQATGIDDKGRKQYIYHALWQEARQQQKFDTLIEFGKNLPLIRKHIRKQLKKTLELNKEQVLCAIIYLLDISCARIGTIRYAKNNHSFGLTTLRKKHLLMKNNKAILNFPGKNAKPWHIVLKDQSLITLLKKCEEIPGYELFKYYENDGKPNVITSQDVNGYLQSLTQRPFTAKNFRTWIACREFLFQACHKEAADEKFFIQEVAQLLGHTPSICRKNYIDPDLLDFWKEGRLSLWLKKHKRLFNKKDKLLLSWLTYKKITQKSS